MNWNYWTKVLLSWYRMEWPDCESLDKFITNVNILNIYKLFWYLKHFIDLMLNGYMLYPLLNKENSTLRIYGIFFLIFKDNIRNK